MPPGRPRDNAKHLNAAVNDLATALTGLVTALGHRATTAPVVVRAGTVAAAPRAKGRHGGRKAKVDGRSKGGPGPGKANPVHIAALRGAWARYTPAQRAARIGAMRAGHAKRKRKLAEKAAAKPARRLAKRVVPTKPGTAARKSAWASLSPEQRAARVAAMRAGRRGAPTTAAATAPATN